MLSVILNDVLLFAPTPDLASMLLASRHFSAVTDDTLVLSASDDVEAKLRPLLLGGIIEFFVLHTNALSDSQQQFDWFVDVLCWLLVGGVVSRTLRLHLSNNYASIGSIYELAERFHYVKTPPATTQNRSTIPLESDPPPSVLWRRSKSTTTTLDVWISMWSTTKLTEPNAARSEFVKFSSSGPRDALTCEVPLEIQRIVAILEAPSTPGYAIPLDNEGQSVDNLMAAYQKEFNEDIKDSEKLCAPLALREDDARHILQRCPKKSPLSYAHRSTFHCIFNNARPNVFEIRRGNVCLRQGYKEVLAKWKQGSSA